MINILSPFERSEPRGGALHRRFSENSLQRVKSDQSYGQVGHDGRHNGPLCNKWFQGLVVKLLVDEGKVDLSEVRKVVNEVQFEMFNTFDKVV